MITTATYGDTVTIETTTQAGISIAFRVVDLNCKALFVQKNEASSWPPPKTIPPELLAGFTLNGQIAVHNRYFAQRQNGGDGYDWTSEYIDEIIKTRSIRECYSSSDCDNALAKYQHVVKGKHGIVFGTQTPWAETLLLRHGAEHVTTYEYMPIHTNHSRLSAITPAQAAASYLAGSLAATFDFAFSYSSFEHDGLGRYGDPLNPFGDMESITKVACLIRPGGYFFLAMPTGTDDVVWNAHRVYGKIRYPFAISAWELIDVVGAYNLSQAFGHHTSPVLVLKNNPAGGQANLQRLIEHDGHKLS